MILLSCDTSNSTCCAGVYENTRPIAFELSNDPRTHSETFMPLVRRVMKQAEVTFDDIDFFAVTTGPGSFTGIRIGLSAVKGMALASGKKVIPVSSTMALARSCDIARDDGRNVYFVPAFDARNSRVFARMINARTYDTIIDENAYDASDLALQISHLVSHTKPRILVLGNGADTLRDYLNEHGVRAEYACGAVITPQGISRAALLDPKPIDGAFVQATYCAVSQAERCKK